MSIRRAVIIGAGAVGAGTAAQLALHGIDHLLIGRGQQIRHIAEHGLRYRRPDGEHLVRLNTAEGIGAAELDAGDLLIMATKTQHVEAAAEQLAWKPAGDQLASERPILTLQNGLAAEPILLRRFSKVYGGSILIPASYTETGTVIAGAAPKVAVFVMGRMPAGSDPQAEQIAQLLRRIDWMVQVDDHVVAWKALKLLRSVRNGLDLMRIPDADVKQHLAAAASEEAAGALAAAGIPVARDADRTADMSQFQVDPASGYTIGQQSTWQSFARGADSHEVDYLNGEIVQLGRLHGVPTPVNTAIQTTLGRAGLQGTAPGEIPADDVIAAARVTSA